MSKRALYLLAPVGLLLLNIVRLHHKDAVNSTLQLVEEFSSPTRMVNRVNEDHATKKWVSRPEMKHNYALLSEPRLENYTPVYWHIPKAGGTTIKNIYLICRGMVVANQIGGNQRAVPSWNATALTVHSPWRVDGVDVSVVNVDTSTARGIKRAKELGLAESRLAETVFSPLVGEAATIFSPEHKGRVFALFRHPVDREVSKFYYLQDAYWEKTYSPETKNWTVQQYTASRKFSRDWMMHAIMGKKSEELTDDDLQTVKDFIQSRVLVGLMSKTKESVERFDQFFGFREKDEKTSSCSRDLLSGKGEHANKHSHPKILPGSKDWEAFAEGLRWDIQLYEYVVELFEGEQRKLFSENVTVTEG